MIKKFLIFILVIAAAVLVWFAFGFWSGIYSVYTAIPSTEYPEGATLIVEREPDEPLFNSTDYRPPPPKPRDPNQRGLSLAPLTKPRKPLAQRTIVELPYIEWAYKKSLEPAEPEETN
jgi:hypothetical protein